MARFMSSSASDDFSQGMSKAWGDLHSTSNIQNVFDNNSDSFCGANINPPSFNTSVVCLFPKILQSNFQI
ncbi:hypothetical protein HZS_4428 [Henneguya salminicola]|nr:hypothetical protein HZS_4428 [Henneguya salminicola]